MPALRLQAGRYAVLKIKLNIMCKTSKIEKEYDTLRHELNENKRYIFERPLLIFSSALVLFKLSPDILFAALIPGFFIFLLVFNLHFTYNRLLSSARIIAYIRLHIECDHTKIDEFYWETFLDNYRNGLKSKKGIHPDKEKDAAVSPETVESSPGKIPSEKVKLNNPDTDFKFYPIIFYFHIISIIILSLLEVLILLKSFRFSIQDCNLFDTITVFSTILVFCGSLLYLLFIRKLVRPETVQDRFITAAKDVEEIL